MVDYAAVATATIFAESSTTSSVSQKDRGDAPPNHFLQHEQGFAGRDK